MSVVRNFLLEDINKSLKNQEHVISQMLVKLIIHLLNIRGQIKCQLIQKSYLSYEINKLLSANQDNSERTREQLILQEELNPDFPSTHYSALDLVIEGKNVILSYADHYDYRFRAHPEIIAIVKDLKQRGYSVSYYQIGGHALQHDENNCMFFAIDHLRKTWKYQDFINYLQKYADEDGNVNWHKLPYKFLKNAQGMRFFCHYLKNNGLKGPNEHEVWNQKNIMLFKDIYPNLSLEQQKTFCFVYKTLEKSVEVKYYNKQRHQNQRILSVSRELISIAKNFIESNEPIVIEEIVNHTTPTTLTPLTSKL